MYNFEVGDRVIINPEPQERFLGWDRDFVNEVVRSKRVGTVVRVIRTPKKTDLRVNWDGATSWAYSIMEDHEHMLVESHLKPCPMKEY